MGINIQPSVTPPYHQIVKARFQATPFFPKGKLAQRTDTWGHAPGPLEHRPRNGGTELGIRV